MFRVISCGSGSLYFIRIFTEINRLALYTKRFRALYWRGGEGVFTGKQLTDFSVETTNAEQCWRNRPVSERVRLSEKPNARGNLHDSESECNDRISSSFKNGFRTDILLSLTDGREVGRKAAVG